MTLTTYAGLQEAVANWLERDDLEDRIPDFITLLESKLYAGERGDSFGWVRAPLRVRAMIATDTLTPADGAVDLTDLTRFIEIDRIYSASSPGQAIRYLAPKDFWGRNAPYEAGPPCFYTMEGFTLRIGPYNTTDLEIAFYQRFAAMSADGDTNWVLENHPEVYLNGALAEAYGFEETTDQRDFYAAKLNAAVNALQQAEEWAAASGSELVIAPPAVV